MEPKPETNNSCELPAVQPFSWPRAIEETAYNLISEYHIKTAEDSQQIYIWKENRYVLAQGGLQKIVLDKLRIEADFKPVQDSYVHKCISLIKSDTMTPREKFNTNHEYIPLQNGYLKIEDGTLIKADPDLIYTWALPVKYQKDAKCSITNRLIDSILGEHRDTFWEFMGYCLYNKTIKKSSLLLYGTHNTGKTTVTNLLRWFLGEKNLVYNELRALTEDRWATSTLVDKLLNIGNDMSAKTIKDDSMFKKITDGNAIQVEQKGIQPFSYVPTCKLIFNCNDLPKVENTSSAYYERLNLIKCENEIENGDESFKHGDWVTDEEKSGMLNKALIGLQKIRANKKFSNVLSWKDTMEEYTKNTDTVEYFIGKCVTEDFESLTPIQLSHTVIYKCYQSFCEALKITAVKRSSFFHAKNTWKSHFGDDSYVKRSSKGREVCHIKIDLLYISNLLTSSDNVSSASNNYNRVMYNKEGEYIKSKPIGKQFTGTVVFSEAHDDWLDQLSAEYEREQIEISLMSEEDYKDYLQTKQADYERAIELEHEMVEVGPEGVD